MFWYRFIVEMVWSLLNSIFFLSMVILCIFFTWTLRILVKSNAKWTKIELVPDIYRNQLDSSREGNRQKYYHPVRWERAEYYLCIEPIKIQQIDMKYDKNIYLTNSWKQQWQQYTFYGTKYIVIKLNTKVK